MKLTAFEANGELYEYKRIPFGLTNAVPSFQRAMNCLAEEEHVKDTFPYLDDITIGGRDKMEHDLIVKKFKDVCNRRNLTINHKKTVRGVPALNILGYRIGNGKKAPDSERLHPLHEMLPPNNLKELKHVKGIFAYYNKWIKDFSTKLKPFSSTTVFPIFGEALRAFRSLKKDLVGVTLANIDEELPFTVEIDASNVALSATLNQAAAQ